MQGINKKSVLFKKTTHFYTLLIKNCFFDVLFEVGISVEATTIGVEEFLTLFEGDFAFLDGLLHPHFERTNHLLGFVLHVAEHIGNGLTVDDVLDVVAVLVGRDVNGIGITEEVVHVAKDFLISSDEEYTYVVGAFLLVERVDRYVVVDTAFSRDIGDFTV